MLGSSGVLMVQREPAYRGFEVLELVDGMERQPGDLVQHPAMSVIEMLTESFAFDAFGVSGVGRLLGLPIITRSALAHDRGVKVDVSARSEPKDHEPVVLVRRADQVSLVLHERRTSPRLPPEMLIEAAPAG